MKRSDIPTKAVLKACHRSHNGDELASFEILMKELNAPENVVYAAMDREDDRGFIDYGVSLRTAWVTEKGYEKLKELEESEDDGYRYLKDGEIIEKGDEFKDNHTGEWNLVNKYAIGRVCTAKILPPIRRKIK